MIESSARGHAKTSTKWQSICQQDGKEWKAEVIKNNDFVEAMETTKSIIAIEAALEVGLKEKAKEFVEKARKSTPRCSKISWCDRFPSSR